VRIIAGTYRGLTLANLGKGDPSAHLRPTTDRVRESLFNVLAGGRFGDVITDVAVLDLFAGTGALGLEALSRGAAQITFVDDGAKAINLIRQNVNLCQAEAQTAVLRRDAQRLGACQTAAFKLIFLDPPYGKGRGERAFKSADEGGWIAPDAMLVWEENSTITVPKHCRVVDSRRYGFTTITLLRYQR
jgi:16S rRNA (guanine966-N2)-methyltransferase